MLDGADARRKMVLNLARYSGVAPALSGMLGGLGAILMLHRVTASPSRPLGLNRHLAVTPDFLDRLVGDMKKSGYRFVSMDEMVEAIRAGGTRPRHATITLDDAYRDNLLEALPVLEAHNAPFTIYTAPGLTEGSADLWWDVLEDVVTQAERVILPSAEGELVLDCATQASKVEAYSFLLNHLTARVTEDERQPLLREMARQVGVDHRAPSAETLMNWEEVRAIGAHRLGTIGAHTINHYHLKRLSREIALREMVESADVIEARTGVRPRHFAYPYGYEAAVGSREVELAAEAGFASAVTTRHGVIKPAHAHHLHALPRISVNGRFQEIGYMRTMLSGVTTLLANSGRGVVTV